MKTYSVKITEKDNESGLEVDLISLPSASAGLAALNIRYVADEIAGPVAPAEPAKRTRGPNKPKDVPVAGNAPELPGQEALPTDAPADANGAPASKRTK